MIIFDCLNILFCPQDTTVESSPRSSSLSSQSDVKYPIEDSHGEHGEHEEFEVPHIPEQVPNNGGMFDARDGVIKSIFQAFKIRVEAFRRLRSRPATLFQSVEFFCFASIGIVVALRILKNTRFQRYLKYSKVYNILPAFIKGEK